MFSAKEIHHENGHYPLACRGHSRAEPAPPVPRRLRPPRTHQLGHEPQPGDPVLIGVSGETFEELVRVC